MESFYVPHANSYGNAFKDFDTISPTVQAHLKQVYLTLCSALIVWAVGSYLHILWNIGGFSTTFACLVCIIWLLVAPPKDELDRLSLLGAAALFEGASIGPQIHLAILVDPSILVTSFLGCAIVFGCFSAAAMFARRREFFYLGTFLSSGVSILVWVHCASFLFGGSASLFKFELYFGLLVFVGYIVFDTQDIIEEAHRGDLDYVKHVLTLFIDFVEVFVRILNHAIESIEDEEEEEEKRRLLNGRRRRRRTNRQTKLALCAESW